MVRGLDYSEIREKFFRLYGQKCDCCGESHKEFLTLDHKLRNGASERKRLSQKAIYKNAIICYQYGDFRQYRVLCMNCNWAKRLPVPCPHRRERKTINASSSFLGI